jgi:predicted secreted Zn-dependent protease
MSARVIQVIETTLALRGSGKSEADPMRRVTQYWTLDGTLLAEVDPHLSPLGPAPLAASPSLDSAPR